MLDNEDKPCEVLDSLILSALREMARDTSYVCVSNGLGFQSSGIGPYSSSLMQEGRPSRIEMSFS